MTTTTNRPATRTTAVVHPVGWYAHTNMHGECEIWNASAPQHQLVHGEVDCRGAGLRALWEALPRMQWGVLGERPVSGDYGISRYVSEAQARLVAWLRNSRAPDGGEVVHSLDGKTWSEDYEITRAADVLPDVDDLTSRQGLVEVTLRDARRWVAVEPDATDHLAALIQEAQARGFMAE